MIQQILDKRKLVRTIDLMKSDNPEEAATNLQKILNESLIAYSSGNTRLQKSALGELKHLKNAMMAQQINAGDKTQHYTVAFSTMIEKFDKTIEEATHSNNSFDSTIASVYDNLPSVDTLTTALMTANPIMGYGVKMISDIRSKAKASISNARKQAEERKRILEQEKQQLEQLVNSVDDQSKSVVDQTEAVIDGQDNLSDVFNRKFDDNSSALFNEIASNTRALVKVWDAEAFIDSNEVLERIADIDEERLDLERESLRQQEISNIEQERQNTKNNSSIVVQGDNGSAGSDILAGFGMGAGFGGFKGILGSLKGLFKFFGSLKNVIRVAAKFAIIGTVISALVDMVDGFYDAHKFFDGEIGIKERIISAFSSFIGGIVDTVDWLAGLVGLNFLDEEYKGDKLTQKIVNVISNIYDSVLNFFDTIIDGTTDAIEGIGNIASRIYDKMYEIYDSGMNFFSNIIDDIKSTVTDDKLYEIYDSGMNFFSNIIDDIKSTVTDFSIGDLFSFGDNTETKTRSQVRQEQRMNGSGSDAIRESANQTEVVAPVTNNTAINAPTTNIFSNGGNSFMPMMSKNNDSDVREIRSRSNARRYI